MSRLREGRCTDVEVLKLEIREDVVTARCTDFIRCTRRLPKVCTWAKARKHVLHGGSSYLAYVIDSRVGINKKTEADVPVVSECPDVYPDN
ncbi:hypothetical protein OSB04_013164 [Centaurea solstitialis]|uniref:Uncharacterized protein n=1 Tax=Centaurea solstitialis TaxID=347529 RepID=A0AA38TPG0_9ASTR|nr:hypothetical protein OSB04_013163 [Centaurea solstitialis]KAJ9558550.1 hypothetical protein OSB04_013164 [Centaurea solstitialis]